MKANRTEVFTERFENSHGRLPRGDGSWAFQFSNGAEHPIFWFNGLFRDARKAAVDKAKGLETGRDLVTIIVLP